MDGKQNKYLFKVEIPSERGCTTYVHEFFGATPEDAEKHARNRFGPDAVITCDRQTG
jgi:hypothetical protein